MFLPSWDQNKSLRTQFGLQKIEKGLTTIQIKLMELINKNYVLKSRETIALHRDIIMKNIEINKLLDRLVDSIRLVMRDLVATENRSRTPLKAMISTPGGLAHDEWTYSRDESAPRMARIRHETRLSTTPQGKDDYYRNKSASTRKPNSEFPDLHSGMVSTDFASQVKVILENIQLAIKRGSGLASEYKKIDDNLHKLVKFLSSKQKSSLLKRYSSMLERSEHKKLAEKVQDLKSHEQDCKESVLHSLQSCYDRLRQNVNAMKNQTKERRDILIVMVRNDKLTVENIHTSPKKV